MTIPQQVKKVYDNPEFVCNYKGYQVYCENYGKECPAIGMPEFLLFDNGKTRFADKNEIHDIMDKLPDD